MTTESIQEELPADSNEPATKGDVYQVFARTNPRIDELTEIVASSFEKLTQQFDQKITGLDEKIDWLEQRVEARFEQQTKQVIDHFDAAVENIKDEMAGANKDEISLIKDQKIPGLENRIKRLEERADLPGQSAYGKYRPNETP